MATDAEEQTVSVELISEGVIRLGWNGQTRTVEPLDGISLVHQISRQLYEQIRLALAEMGVKTPDTLVLNSFSISFRQYRPAEVNAEVTLSQFPHVTSHRRVNATGRYELEAWVRAVVAALTAIAFNNQPRGHPI